MATLKEQREKIIKDRAARLAKDAKRQGMTPEQLLKKRRDTYLGVVGGAATLALPFGAILRGAKSLFTAAKGVKKGKDVSKALKTSKTKKTPSTTTTKTTKTTTTKKVDTKKTPTKTTKKVDTKKTPTKQTKKADKKKKKTDTKKKVSGSTIPKVIGAGGTAALLTTIIAKKKDGSAKAGAMPKSRPKSIKPTDFGMGMVDDFSKSKVKRPRRTDNMEGGTAPIKPKKKKSDISQGSTMAKTPKKAKPITAGSNVGFGPKGNIFPKNAADRKRLMDKFGGTGSAAAKAAAQGKQGNLKKVGRT
jgi:hypothetical protein